MTGGNPCLKCKDFSPEGQTERGVVYTDGKMLPPRCIYVAGSTGTGEVAAMLVAAEVVKLRRICFTTSLT